MIAEWTSAEPSEPLIEHPPAAPKVNIRERATAEIERQAQIGAIDRKVGFKRRSTHLKHNVLEDNSSWRTNWWLGHSRPRFVFALVDSGGNSTTWSKNSYSSLSWCFD